MPLSRPKLQPIPQPSGSITAKKKDQTTETPEIIHITHPSKNEWDIFEHAKVSVTNIDTKALSSTSGATPACSFQHITCRIAELSEKSIEGGLTNKLKGKITWPVC